MHIKHLFLLEKVDSVLELGNNRAFLSHYPKQEVSVTRNCEAADKVQQFW